MNVIDCRLPEIDLTYVFPEDLMCFKALFVFQILIDWPYVRVKKHFITLFRLYNKNFRVQVK